MSKYIIGDTHFGHTNIIKYEDRPFNSTREMDQYMIYQWNKVVDKNDLVFHLGDVFLCSTDRQFEIKDKLNGDIIVIRGNHDHQSRTKFIDRLGFKNVYDDLYWLKNDVLLSHRPSNNINFNLNIHAHTHSQKKNTYNQICVSVEND